jgi:translation initiation factor 3 subunit A
VKPEAAALFRLLEVDFSPLTLVQRALPLLSWVGSQTNPTLPTQSQGSGTAPAPGAPVSQSLSQYLPNLQRLLVFRLLEHLTQVYSTVLIPNFQNLISGLNVSFFDVEKIAVRAVRLRQLAVRIDHRAGIIKLGTESTEKDSMRRRLTTLASRLQVVAEAIAPAPEETSVVPRDRRDQVFDYARIFSEDHRKEIMRRKDHVQRRKEEKEKALYKQHQDVSPYSLNEESRVTVSKMQQRFRAIYAKPLPISKDITCKNIVVV